MGSEDLHLRKWGELADEYLGPAFIRKFEDGDILYGSRRTYLRKVVIAPFDGITSNTTFVIKANEDKIDRRLLPFVMLSEGFAQHSIRNSKGSVNPYVNWKDLAGYEFLLPPKAQQAELAELLWALDELVSNNQKTLAELKRFQRIYFESLLQTNLDDRAKLRDVLIDIFAGKSPKGFSRQATDNEYGVLKVSAVGDGVYLEQENKTLVNQDEFNPTYEVKTGFILVTRANAQFSGVGRPCMVNETRPGLMLSDKTLRLIPDKSRIRERFLFQLVRSSPYRKHVESVAGGTEAKNISQKLLGEAPIWVPNENRQIKIENNLLSSDKGIELATLQLNDSRIMQKSVLNQIF